MSVIWLRTFGSTFEKKGCKLRTTKTCCMAIKSSGSVANAMRDKPLRSGLQIKRFGFSGLQLPFFPISLPISSKLSAAPNPNGFNVADSISGPSELSTDLHNSYMAYLAWYLAEDGCRDKMMAEGGGKGTEA